MSRLRPRVAFTHVFVNATSIIMMDSIQDDARMPSKKAINYSLNPSARLRLEFASKKKYTIQDISNKILTVLLTDCSNQIPRKPNAVFLERILRRIGSHNSARLLQQSSKARELLQNLNSKRKGR